MKILISIFTLTRKTNNKNTNELPQFLLKIILRENLKIEFAKDLTYFVKNESPFCSTADLIVES